MESDRDRSVVLVIRVEMSVECFSVGQSRFRLNRD